MQKYNLRIDGQISPYTYTYQELVEQGLFDLDDTEGFEVKGTNETYYRSIEDYPFPERQRGGDSSSDYYIDEYGQMHRKPASSSSKATSSGSSSKSDYYIDEYGQMHRRGTITSSCNSSSSTYSSSSNSSTSSSSSSSYNSSSSSSSSDDGPGAFGWLCIIGGAIFGLVVGEGDFFAAIGGAALGFGAGAILKGIFD